MLIKESGNCPTLAIMPPKHRLIELPERKDARGTLLFAQEGDNFPFAAKRFFCHLTRMTVPSVADMPTVNSINL